MLSYQSSICESKKNWSLEPTSLKVDLQNNVLGTFSKLSLFF